MNILLVEDDDDVRQTMREILEDEGHDVSECSNGLVGSRTFLAQMKTVDLVITDLQMPARDGFDLIDTVSMLKGQSRVPVLVISGYLTADARKRLESRPDITVLEKPVPQDRLLKAVEASCA